MHTTLSAYARRFYLFASAPLILLFLTGCELTITNLTPETLPQNPSNIYIIQARIKAQGANIIEGTVRPRIIIDGQSFPLTQSPLAPDLYEFEYHLPSGRDEAAYYYVVNYQIKDHGITANREEFTDLFRMKLADRYVLSLESNRAPVGAKVSVLGRGFSRDDVVYLDDAPARTLFESANSVGFFVPNVTPGRNYTVRLRGPSSDSLVGTFRVDPVSIQVVPQTIHLRSGERQMLVFSIPDEAPPGGLLLDVTTDIPASVIMPEILIPPGSRSISVPFQAGSPGTGSIYLQSTGGGEMTIPVTITQR